jgi:hypothetical protein
MINFEQIPHLLEENWKKLAIARAEWEYLDEMRKVVISKQASKYEWSEAMKDRLARTTEEYKTHLMWTREARELQLTLEATQEALKARFEWYRTQNANRRMEMWLN